MEHEGVNARDGLLYHGMYGDALQLVAMTTMGGEDGAIAKYLRDEIHSVARRAAAAVTNAYSVEVTI